MKKLLNIVLFLTIAVASFGEYSYPLKNPYMATILGSSQMMTPNIKKNVPRENYKVKIDDREIPEQFWYSEGFKFSLIKQKEKAPLIFLLAGTGASYNSLRNKLFQRILYTAGYNVISMPSVTNGNFLLNISKTKMPGIIYEDSIDMYKAMKIAYEKVKDEIDVSEFYLMGYSLGATESGMIAYIDEGEKAFDFKRVFMVNPAVDAYKSAIRLDNFVSWEPVDRAKNMKQLIEDIVGLIKSNANPEYQKLDIATVFSIFSKVKMSDDEMKKLIGGAFRLSSMNLNYVSDIVNGLGIYNKPSDSKFRPNFDDFENINFASFNDYIDKLAMPYLVKEYHLDKDEVLKKASLKYIEEYLKTSKKVVAVTNADELILDDEDLKFLENTFGNRVIVYPYGGHCGNMFYAENVNIMLKFLKTGELKYEN